METTTSTKTIGPVMLLSNEKDLLNEEELKLLDDLTVAVNDWYADQTVPYHSIDYFIIKGLLKAGWKKQG